MHLRFTNKFINLEWSEVCSKIIIHCSVPLLLLIGSGDSLNRIFYSKWMTHLLCCLTFYSVISIKINVGLIVFAIYLRINMVILRLIAHGINYQVFQKQSLDLEITNSQTH